MSRVPDSLRHFVGACESGSALGPVVEVGEEKCMLKNKLESRWGPTVCIWFLLEVK